MLGRGRMFVFRVVAGGLAAGRFFIGRLGLVGLLFGGKCDSRTTHAVARVVEEPERDGKDRAAGKADRFIECERRDVVLAELRIDGPGTGCVVVDCKSTTTTSQIESRHGWSFKIKRNMGFYTA